MKNLLYLLPVVLMMYACGGGGGTATGGGDVLATLDDSICYAIGSITAENFQKQEMTLNSTNFKQGFDDAKSESAYLSEAEVENMFRTFTMELQMKQQMAQMDPSKPVPPSKINMDTLSYCMGIDLYGNLKESGVGLNSAAIYAGNADTYAGTSKMTEEQKKASMAVYQTRAQAAYQAKSVKEMATNMAAGEAFLAEKAKEDGMKKTESGLLYKVITQGNGAKPKATDKVEVHYVGTLIDGTEFDSSVRRGEPIEFPLNGVIPGWTEGVQLMAKGSKFRFYIPQHLAYGERGSPPKIGPGATLVFDIELLNINK